jgi:hypothetical protein
MPFLNVRNVDIDFPKDPYPCQINYLEKLIDALTTSNNALLESPTGTGKTLSLLCGSLAWQAYERRRMEGMLMKSDPKNKIKMPNFKGIYLLIKLSLPKLLTISNICIAHSFSINSSHSRA